jgi:hypothetical protein
VSAIDPGPEDVQHAWTEWQRAVTYGYPTAAKEWREMYLALLDRVRKAAS